MADDLWFDWDEAKRAANIAKHGVDFTETARLDWSATLTEEQVRDGETRCLSYAPLDGRLHALVWTQRGQAIRLISLRRANKREYDRYVKETDSPN